MTRRLHAYPGNVIVMTIVIAKSMCLCQSLNAATSIVANPSPMVGIGDRREGVDDARHAETVSYWES